LAFVKLENIKIGKTLALLLASGTGSVLCMGGLSLWALSAIRSSGQQQQVEACQFGKWLYRTGIAATETQSENYRQTRQLNPGFHEEASKVAQLAISGQKGAAGQAWARPATTPAFHLSADA
jgi:hypothetical protein